MKTEPEMAEMIGLEIALMNMLNDFQENTNIKVDKWNL